MNKSFITLGNRVRVSDPCYDTSVWCSGELTNVKPGKYEVIVSRSDCGDWGKRVVALRVTHEDYSGIPMGFNATASFEVGVDSGQAGIFDADYYDKHHVKNDCNEDDDDEWYEEICNLTLSKEQFGTLDDKCAVSRSGFGDGVYRCVLTKDFRDNIISIGIIFITKEDLEEI